MEIGLLATDCALGKVCPCGAQDKADIPDEQKASALGGAAVQARETPQMASGIGLTQMNV
jgi:hypothetical protein